MVAKRLTICASTEWTIVTPLKGPFTRLPRPRNTQPRAPTRQCGADIFRGDGNMGSDAQVSSSDSSDDRPGGGGVPPAHEIRVGVVGVGYWGSKQLRVMRATPGVTG